MFWKIFTENCKPQAFPGYFQGKLVGLAEGSYGYIAQKTASKRSEMLGRKNSRKGLSPLLAIIIGLIVTIVAGILLAQLYFSYAATISARPAANIEYSDLVVSDNTGILTINIKNIGNIPITAITATGFCSYSSAQDSSFPQNGVSPGSTFGFSCSGTATIGNTYVETVVVTFQDGSSQVYGVSVRARGA